MNRVFGDEMNSLVVSRQPVILIAEVGDGDKPSSTEVTSFGVV